MCARPPAYALRAISEYQRPQLVLGMMNDCQVFWPMWWSPSLRDFGSSGWGTDGVKWLWQPVASFWPSQASIASGSGSSAYSPTSRRPLVDKGWGSCRQAFGEIKTWPNFLQSMSERGTRRSSASFPFFSTPAVLELVQLPVCLCQHHCCPLPPLQSPRSTPQLLAPLEVAPVQKLTRTPLVGRVFWWSQIGFPFAQNTSDIFQSLPEMKTNSISISIDMTCEKMFSQFKLSYLTKVFFLH